MRVIRRVGRSGLTQTCLVAMLASRRAFVAMLEPGLRTFDPHLRRDAWRLCAANADLAVAARPRAASGGFRASVRGALVDHHAPRHSRPN